jgi:uncharacterized delta-60 repeat protein/uncharacterized repeat protein (TIGR01451 family)
MQIRICVLLLLILCTTLIYSQSNKSAELDEEHLNLGLFNSSVRKIIPQNDGKILVGGDFTSFKDNAVGRIARLFEDGTLDTSFHSEIGFNNAVWTIDIQPDGKILVGGTFTSVNGSAANKIARLNSDGSIDNSFNPDGANGTVYSIVLQSDGRILVGGAFTTFNGLARNRLVRLNADGSLDSGFNASVGANNGIIQAICTQADGKILVGGSFTTFNTLTIGRITRLNSDGTLDNAFISAIGSGANSDVISLIQTPDLKILISGTFTSFNGVTQNRITRLTSSGSVDSQYFIGTGANNAIYSQHFLSNGKLLIAGDFTIINGVNRIRIARLNQDGSVDLTFNANASANLFINAILQVNQNIWVGGNFTRFNNIKSDYFAKLDINGVIDQSSNFTCGLDDRINEVIVQPDGKILFAGQFNYYNNIQRAKLIRLNPDGSFDNSFDQGIGFNGNIETMALLPNGKILLGGYFQSYNGNSRNFIIRLNPDGSFDNSFGSAAPNGPNDAVNYINVLPDGKIVIVGNFTYYNGVQRNKIARLNPDGSLDLTFNPGSGANGNVAKVIVLPDGRYLLGGIFTTYNGAASNYVACILPNGSLDVSVNFYFSNHVRDLELQSDGKVLVCGEFTTYNGNSKSKILRLNSNLSHDLSFNPGTGANFIIHEITVLPNGKIMIGGNFTSFNGVTRNYIAQLNIDGSLDLGFNSTIGANNLVFGITPQNDEKIIVVGAFNTFNNISVNYIARLNGDRHYNKIKGKVFTDMNNDCIPSVNEPIHASAIIKAIPGPFYGGLDTTGGYQIKVDTGTNSYYIYRYFNPITEKLLLNQCYSFHEVSSNGSNKTFSSYDFSDTFDVVNSCALLNVNIHQSFMRRCARNHATVTYTNHGNKSAQNTILKVRFPEYIIPISSNPMWNNKEGSTVIYNLGTVDPDQSFSIKIIDSVMCYNESIRGLTQCITASITPDEHCESNNPSWDQSSINILGSCNSDSIRFTIQNVGTGNMLISRPYRLYRNDTLIFSSSFILENGAQFTISYPSDGNTMRLEADQHLLHPGKSRPRATIEGCGSSQFGDALVRQHVATAPMDEENEEKSVTCGIIRDSYDPNDKSVIPAGQGPEKLTSPNSTLYYKIRFQNTGTDTAFTVKIVDTLDENLNMESFIEGVCSHKYSLAISGKSKPILTWTFYDINLPDSSTNYLMSNGFVTFQIKNPSTIGTEIRNKAYIYFDYNSAIITNETLNKIGFFEEENFSFAGMVGIGNITTKLTYGMIDKQLKLYPNPAHQIVNIEIPQASNKMEFRIINPLGKVVKEFTLINQANQQINLHYINSGTYFYELWQEGGRRFVGLIQVW